MQQDLTLALIKQKNILDEVLIEILDHQGIIYDVISMNTNRKYPLVMMSKYSEDAFSRAKIISEFPENAIVVEKLIDLNGVLRSLSGLEGKARDSLNVDVNLEESKLANVLRKALAAVNLPLVRKWFWPNGARACFVLTHDVDWFTYSPYHRVVLEGTPKTRILKTICKNLIRRRNYGWNIPELIQLHQKSGIKSTFLFQTDYGELNPYFTKSVELLNAAGFEIALHASHNSHKNEGDLHKELDSFAGATKLSPAGVRYHTLKFLVPLTWRIESDLGIQYDATFSYNKFFGYRSNICFPYHPFNDARYRILELPTGFMDWTTLHRKYRGSKLTTILHGLEKSVEENHGVLLVNFHNTYLNSETFPDVYASYVSLINEVKNRSYWITTARQCAEWWNYRVSFKPKPVLDDDKLVVYGDQNPLLLSDGTAAIVSINRA